MAAHPLSHQREYCNVGLPNKEGPTANVFACDERNRDGDNQNDKCQYRDQEWVGKPCDLEKVLNDQLCTR